ncbi:UDP-N-acetyl-D-mannosamine dehydrogenase, partial [Paenarthrobacter sp. RAF9]
GLSRLHGQDEAIAAADLVLLLVDHDDFLTVDPASLEGKQVIDTKGIWNQPDVAEASLQHIPVGASAGG